MTSYIYAKYLNSISDKYNFSVKYSHEILFYNTSSIHVRFHLTY